MNWRVDYNQLFLANIYPFIHGHTFRPCLYFTNFVFLNNKKYIRINSEMRTIWCIISTTVTHKITNNSLRLSFYVTTNVISYFNQGYVQSNSQRSSHIFLAKKVLVIRMPYMGNVIQKFLTLNDRNIEYKTLINY